jgi:flagellar assembly factor FliW
MIAVDAREVDEEPAPTVLAFPDGLVGLPDLRRFELAPVAGTALFQLDSLDDPDIGFVVARADDVRAGTSEAVRSRGFMTERDALLTLLSIHGDPPVVTANLAGPVVVDLEAATARQVVLEDPAFPLRVPLEGTR